MRALLAAALLALAPASAAAAPLGLADARTRAEAASPDVRVAEARLERARGRRGAAGYLTPTNPALEVDVETSLPGGDGELGLAVGVTQELELFGQRGLRVDAAAAEVQLATEELAAARRDAAADAAVAWIELWYAQEVDAQARAALAQAESRAEAARRKLAAGDLAEVEVTLVDADLAGARATVAEAGGARDAARARLNLLVGEPPGAETTAGGEPPELRAPLALDALVARALERRPELRVAGWAAEAARREVSLRRRERWPNVTLFLGYRREEAVFDVAGAAVEDTDQLLGFSLSIPLPLFRTGHGEVAEARGRHGEAEARRAAAEREIGAQVAGARAAFEAARARLAAWGEVAPRLGETLARYEQAWAAGQLELAELFAFRERVVSAQLAILAARRDAAAAAAELERAVGGEFAE